MIDVILTPADVQRVESILPQSQVIILDILRATSTLITTLSTHTPILDLKLGPIPSAKIYQPDPRSLGVSSESSR